MEDAGGVPSSVGATDEFTGADVDDIGATAGDN
jgi:hypothetical protein